MTDHLGEANSWSVTRRDMLRAGVAASALSGPALGALAGSTGRDVPDFQATFADGTLQVMAVGAQAFRVRFVSGAVADGHVPPSQMLVRQKGRYHLVRRDMAGATRLELPAIHCEIPHDGSALRFLTPDGRLLLSEQAGTRHMAAHAVRGMPCQRVEQGFISPPEERLYGTGCFQDGHLNLRGLPRRLTQVNTQISLPFLLSSQGYGLLWHNDGMSELNPPDQTIPLQQKAQSGTSQLADVTTTQGNARVELREAVYTGRFSVAAAGRYAFLFDSGGKMTSRYHVEIDGRVLVDHANLWLPPTTSFIAELEPGEHDVRILAGAKDAPILRYGLAAPTTVWRSPVAQAIDYVVIAGPSARQIMEGYRALTGAAPMMPVWTFGYIHCRERFHSSQEILDTAREFRRRRLPVDVMVQDWQYWGAHGWNAMRFDEKNYPDPAGLCHELHGMDLRFMLSVWSKISRDTELGKQFAARGFFISGTDWIDFFNPLAAAFYAESQNRHLGALGIDAWWQDATEPENDDLLGRDTAAGPGERVRLAYPLQVSRTVYEGQRAAFPDRRVMILTRSAFPGQHRYGAATWSGDIGNDWETLRRQVPAGLNMAAAGYPYWTVDAGGFFRPGDGQYTDPAYHARFIRWFQYATFLPLQRVHGYMTNTEFWRYGEQVEAVARIYLDLRYRLLPYIYALAAQASHSGMPLLRPLVFDFPEDGQALDQTGSYMFGDALHVAPVLAPDVTEWPVYLPVWEGGWYDVWTGEHRAGGMTHRVPAPIEHIPLHARAGSILPLGPVVQSTAGALARDLDLLVFPGRDGVARLYEDDGLTYAYEQGGKAEVDLRWDESRHVLTIGARRGHFAGMRPQRQIRIKLVGAEAPPLDGNWSRVISYSGQPVSIALAHSSR
ncbi:TIM-barrel domain-containing protein [Novosphingobium sp.]|uniref:TIM-barrel domain-containing protein n=1 Tax=Novosphingobium sp. TaxID=1874826 RepID=UPI0031D8A68B